MICLRGTRKLFFSQSKTPSAWWGGGVVGGQLHWLRYSRLEAMKVAKDGCVGAGRGSQVFFPAYLNFISQGIRCCSWTMKQKKLLVTWTHICWSTLKDQSIDALSNNGLANLPVMGNAGASIHQGASSRLHLGWQTGVPYVERAWLLHFNFNKRQRTVDLYTLKKVDFKPLLFAFKIFNSGPKSWTHSELKSINQKKSEISLFILSSCKTAFSRRCQMIWFADTTRLGWCEAFKSFVSSFWMM